MTPELLRDLADLYAREASHRGQAEHDRLTAIAEEAHQRADDMDRLALADFLVEHALAS